MEGIGSEVQIMFPILCLLMMVWMIVRQRQNLERNRLDNEIERIHPDHQGFIEELRNSFAPQPVLRENQTNESVVTADQRRYPTESAMLEDDASCPVCLELFIYPVLTNCGHTFCARCFVAYWNHRHWGGAMKCPVCRQDVYILLRRSLVGERQQQRNSSAGPEAAEPLEAVRQYNRRFSGETRSWREHLQDAPVVLRHLATEFFSVGGLLFMFRVRVFLCVAAALVYFLLPLDFIPEAVFGLLGFVDDLFVGGLVVIYLSVLYRQYLADT